MTISAKIVAQRVKQVSGITSMSAQVIESVTIYIDTGQYNKSKLTSFKLKEDMTIEQG